MLVNGIEFCKQEQYKMLAERALKKKQNTHNLKINQLKGSYKSWNILMLFYLSIFWVSP